MQTIASHLLANIVGGESFGDVMKALKAAPQVSPAQTYTQTLDFIRDHPFFHQGVMNLPIGGGKHFRNVPFVGPSRIIGGLAHGDGTQVQRGIQTTRATWDAP